MDSHRCSCIKLFTFFLPLLCLLFWSWPALSTHGPTAAPLLPPPSSTRLAADTLRDRGYSLFASLLDSMSVTTNFSGTLLAPPDFAFSSAAAKFLSTRLLPPLPSVSLLLYHTIRPPLILSWPALSSRRDGDEFHTLDSGNCLYLFRSPYGGEISVSSTPYKNPMVAVKIRQPDLFHGIDGVLDQSFSTKCNFPFPDPVAEGAVPRRVNQGFLDRAVRALRRTGYNVVAAAMAFRKSDLLSLTSVTVFAVSDENLFLKPSGFRYNFRHHVVPVRHRFANLARITTAGGTDLETLSPNKTVFVDTVDGTINVDGVAVDETEVYRNKWIVVVSVMKSLDDVVLDSQIKPPTPSPAPFTGVPAIDDSPNPEPEFNHAEGISIRTPPSPSFENDAEIGSPSRAAEYGNETHCDPSTVVSIRIEGGDLLCTESSARQLGEMDDNVDQSKPSDAYTEDLTLSDKVKIAENVNIADDVFFHV
ncbi:fasciclin-like arabinogalactan protein [Striga asiatica]|uniref:Fasciclin-like arabinogalactan protein n=1 Tax=Striga asiatica TaxID=4170 RepID=A0A5A7RM94_STRAF|nr:fasciclin-like arabinogalactan protein [Striga asiatica]